MTRGCHGPRGRGPRTALGEQLQHRSGADLEVRQPASGDLDRNHEVGRCRVRRARLGGARFHVERVEQGSVGTEERDRERHHGVAHREARRVRCVVAEGHAVEPAEIGDLHQPASPGGDIGGEPEAQLAGLAVRGRHPGSDRAEAFAARRRVRRRHVGRRISPPERRRSDTRCSTVVTSIGRVAPAGSARHRTGASPPHDTATSMRSTSHRRVTDGTLREHSGAPGAAHRRRHSRGYGRPRDVRELRCRRRGASPGPPDVRHAGRLGHRRFRGDDARTPSSGASPAARCTPTRPPASPGPIRD